MFTITKFPYLFALATTLLLSAAACKEDEILPEQPAPVVTETASLPEEEPVTEAADSAVYQYARFSNMPYRILFPKNYDPAKSYPLLIFLHGIGERGSDNEQQLRWGASLFQADSVREQYPAFVIFPQCQAGHYWFDSWGTETLKGLVDSISGKYKTDKTFIGGLSMGAYGTYAMVSQYPGLFNGAVAIAGDGDTRKATAMAKTKWRIFAGKLDHIVSSDKSEKMAAALKKSGASVAFTLYPRADHTGSWVNAFSEPDFVSWIFSDSVDNR
jgi:predicted peptidase